MTVYCATTNAGKLREFRMAAGMYLSVEPLPGLSSIVVCEETGSSFEENAIQKALYYGKHCSGLLFAEDSGLEVAALQGEPGIYSARYAGEHASDEANNQLLLRRLDGVGDRSARFVSVIALVKQGNVLGTFRGEVNGTIAYEPKGKGGFGYDPLFEYPAFGCTFGQVATELKQSVSHRGAAVLAMRDFLVRLAETQSTIIPS